MEAKGEAWFGWWQRHALRSCRQGGLFPDLFLRRMVDFAEISWGNSHMEGVGEDFYFTVPQGTVCLPVKQVAEPLLKGLQTAIADLRGRIASDKEFNTLAEKADRITAPGRLNDRLSWYAARLSHIATSVQSLVQNMITPEEGMGFIQRLSPGVAMFGSLAPKISDADLENLIGFYIAAHKNGKESSQLLPLLTQNPELPENDPFDAGYEAALDFLEAQNQNNSLSEWVDVHSICQRLGIQIYSGALGDSNIRGAAFAGSHVTPTIFINTAHPNNQQEEGQRFSIGHELCHILHDRFFGGEISIASGPWAPASIEKRANAFSAMLLMPVELINEKIRISPSPPDTPEGITYLSNALKVSKKSLVWHLYNLNKLDDTQLANLAGYEF
ncbi:MAG TPA: ImmA/IrrE family metallo-endopeptidase [Magnetococcales bacterium]|nr:ImmA/IrrE family metallo-endopeptidase [Magnetococcales bacterium]